MTGWKKPHSIYESHLKKTSITRLGPAGIRIQYISKEIQSYNR